MTEIHTLAGAYVLDAIDDVERARFDRHLAECPSCAAEVAELTETLAALTDASAEQPPAGLRSAVLARVAETPQVAPAARQSSRRPGGSVRRWLVAGAAVVALGAAGTVGYAISGGGGTGHQTTNQADRIAAVIAAPDARVRSMPTGDGQVSVVTSTSQDAAVAVLTDLPSPGAGHSYQLWVIRDQVPRSVGVLADGRIGATQLVSGVRGAQSFGVSREPAGGSSTPTMPLVAQVSLA